MCGIAGYSRGSRDVPDSGTLNAAQASLAHRGPDDCGVFFDREHGIGLAHTRLSILDLSPFGHQPMMSDCKRVVLVFNGEIYNFQELRAELEGLGHQFRGHSDTEVLLNLYLCRSKSSQSVEEMLLRLNGVFAFALWDAERGALLLARDAFGVKPLYFANTSLGFQFASELKAISEVVHTVDVAALDRYLTYLWCPGEATPSTQVRKLGPGEAMWIQSGAIQSHFTWYRLPAFHRKNGEPASSYGLSKHEAIEQTRQHLRAAVHRQMVADVPVGAFLSGGLDSSSVVAFAREMNPDIRCFSIELKGAEDEGITNDLPYARRVAAHLQVSLDVVTVDALRMAEHLPEMVAQLDEPLADPAALNVLYISREARQQGIKVLLSGTGGDDVFTGYRRHRAAMSDALWSWLPKSVRIGLEDLTRGLDQRRPIFRRVRKLFSGASLDGDARLINYFRWIDRRDLVALYAPAFLEALGQVSDETPMLSFLADLPPETGRLDRVLSLEQRFFLADHNLNYTDKMSMAVGVEVRVPFLDLELVEFASQIPGRFKQHGREGKWILKKAMAPYLPHDVIYRPKSGFGVPLRRWMRVELRDLLGDLLSSSSLRKRGLFDPGAVQQLISLNDHGKIDGSYTLLSLMCIELWCRRFIDSSPVKLA